MSSVSTKKLKYRYIKYLYPTPPFNLEGSVCKPSHFLEADLCYENGIYWQTMRFKGGVYGIKMKEIRSVDNPMIEITIYSAKKIDSLLIKQILSEIKFRFDMKADIKEFYNKCCNDEILSPVIERWKGMRVSAHVFLYEFLVITTVLQNATVRRSVQMLDNLFKKYGTTVEFNGQKLYAFWSPRVIFGTSEEELRKIKLGYRAKTLKRQAENFIRGDLEETKLRQLSTPELRKKLLSLYGVGPASEQYILFEVFKRYDVLEYIPPWEQKIYSRLLFNKELVDTDTILKEIKNRWENWRMLAVHYIFEDLFWQRKNRNIPWLEELIRI